jgi:uncharacterized protein YjbJ (UPF0337 family)
LDAKTAPQGVTIAREFTAEGEADKAKGKVHNAFGGLKDTLRGK